MARPLPQRQSEPRPGAPSPPPCPSAPSPRAPQSPREPYRPTTISACSEARGRTGFHRAMAKGVLELLKPDVSEDMSPATITATTRPQSPADRGDRASASPAFARPVTPDLGTQLGGDGAGPAP